MRKAEAKTHIRRALDAAIQAVERGNLDDTYSFAREAADIARAATANGRMRVRPIAHPGELEGDPRYSQSLERGLAILGCFTEKDPVRRLADVADQLGYSRSTTHRYMVTLTSMGLLEQTTGRRYCRPGEIR